VMAEGIVVPDANVFLNLYRYNEPTRNDLFEVMRSLGDRLWVPQWVRKEFWRTRESVLRDPQNINATVKELTSCRDKANEQIRGWVSRVGLSNERAEALSEMLNQGFNSVIEGVRELADDNVDRFARNTNEDPVLGELEPILLPHRVGPPLGDAEIKESS